MVTRDESDPTRWPGWHTYVERMAARAETVDAYRDGEVLRFWCHHCVEWHGYGGGDGWRMGHCRPGGPYQGRGFVLREVGPLTDEVRRTVPRRRKPTRRR